VGLSAWVSLGTLTVTGAGPGAGRVALLPPWWVLITAAAAALAILLPLARRGVPAWPLATLAIILVPWLPLPPAGALLMWAGPLTAWVWVAALAAWACRWAAAPAAPRSQVLAFVLALALFGGAAWQLREARPGGDEPHYLVIVQSLLKDGDLRIENNHERRDYAEYFGGVIGPHFLKRGTDGQIYSVHAPGLPVVVAPAFALGGYQAVVALLVVVAALGMLLTWRVTWLLTGDAGAAWFAWGTSLGAPFFFHSYAVYPDALGAVLVATGILALVRLETRRPLPPWRWVLHGAALALLPWLHTRFAVAAAVLGASIALRLAAGVRFPGQRSRVHGDAAAGEGLGGRTLFAFLVIPAISAVAWFGFFRIIWGTFSPTAPYGTYTQTAASNILRGLPGLLLDQQFGILPNAPACLCALAGFWPLARRRPRLAVELSLLVAAYLAAVSSYHMWWGGWSAPARFAVPVMLALAVTAGAYWAAARRAGRAAGAALLGLTLLITGTMTIGGGRSIFNSRDGFARWLDRAGPNVDLPRALPSFFRDGRALAFGQAAAWLLAFVLALLVLRLVVRAAERRPGANVRLRLATAVPALAALALGGATTVGWRLGGANGVAPLAGQLALLQAYDPERLPIRIGAPARLALKQPEGRPAAEGVLLALGPLPAGTYRLEPASLPAARGTTTVRLGRDERPLATWDLDGRAERTLELPAGAAFLAIEGDEDARATAPGIALRPVTLIPPGLRASPGFARHAAAYGPVIVYAFDGRAWLEEPGLWVRGGVEVPLVFAKGGARRLEVLLRNGPLPNKVEVDGGTWRLDLQLAPRETRAIEVPLWGTPAAALVRVKAERGFRPSETAPGNRDERYLGVWMEVPRP